MIRLTWEWIGQGPALDLADTVTISDDEETDLLALPGEYERWALAEVTALGWSAQDRKLLLDGREEVLAVREPVRAVLGALGDGRSVPKAAIGPLNQISRSAPEWTELHDGALVARSGADDLAVVRGRYARDALRWAAGDAGPLRRCPAPSCGMFYSPGRPQQRWCSTACGTRARVARHYRARKAG